MNEQAILRQIDAYFDITDVDKYLQRIHQMQDNLNALRSGEVQARKEWLNSSELIFPEDFTEEMNKLSSGLQPIENLLKQLDRIEAALNKQREKLKSKK
jgi:hypothetical protein